jgi:hypothetical protein
MKTFLLLVLTGVFLSSAAQQTPFTFKTALSFNPVVLVATDNTAMVGAEHRLSNRFSAVLDAGYIFGSFYFLANVQKGASGFAVRPAIKYYVNNKHRKFIQLQAPYKQVTYKIEDWLGKGCVLGVPSYEKWQRFTYHKKVLSFNTLFGKLYRVNNVLMLELYGGIGVTIKDQGPTEEATCYRNNEVGFPVSRFREHSVTSNFPVGIKLLIALK